jgi:agmatinase
MRTAKRQFLDIPSDPATARAVILPLPLEKTTTYVKGTSRGPEAIVEASSQLEWFDAELKTDPSSLGIHTDWELGNPAWNRKPVEALLDLIRDKAGRILEQGKFLLSLGGEHTITVGLIDPFLKRWGGSLTVVQIDAHADLRMEYQGSLYNHACVMRRLLGRVPIVSAGVRSLDREEYDVARADGIRIFYAHEIHENPDWVPDLVSYIQSENVYLTVDLDGLDPSIMPSVGTPEPGGLTWEQVLLLVRSITRSHRVVGADVNELCPNGSNHHADFTAAKLCYKILGYSLG